MPNAVILCISEIYNSAEFVIDLATGAVTMDAIEDADFVDTRSLLAQLILSASEGATFTVETPTVPATLAITSTELLTFVDSQAAAGAGSLVTDELLSFVDSPVVVYTVNVSAVGQASANFDADTVFGSESSTSIEIGSYRDGQTITLPIDLSISTDALGSSDTVTILEPLRLTSADLAGFTDRQSVVEGLSLVFQEQYNTNSIFTDVSTATGTVLLSGTDGKEFIDSPTLLVTQIESATETHVITDTVTFTAGLSLASTELHTLTEAPVFVSQLSNSASQQFLGVDAASMGATYSSLTSEIVPTIDSATVTGTITVSSVETYAGMFIADGFTGSLANGWGTPDIRGPAYKIWSGTNSFYKRNNGNATIGPVTSVNDGQEAIVLITSSDLGDITAVEQSIDFKWDVNATSGFINPASFEGYRSQNTDGSGYGFYRTRVMVSSIQIKIIGEKFVNEVNTVLYPSTQVLDASPLNTYHRLKVQLSRSTSGVTMAFKLWNLNTPEPTGFTSMFSDISNLPPVGTGWGIRAGTYSSTVSPTFTYQNYRAYPLSKPLHSGSNLGG